MTYHELIAHKPTQMRMNFDELVIDNFAGGGGAFVRDMLQLAGIELHALRVGNSGEPGHPLYIPYSQQPFPLSEVHAW